MTDAERCEVLRKAALVSRGVVDVESVSYLFDLSIDETLAFLVRFRDIEWEPTNLELSRWRVYKQSRLSKTDS